MTTLNPSEVFEVIWIEHIQEFDREGKIESERREEWNIWRDNLLW